MGSVQFFSHSASIHLNLHEVGLLLVQRKQEHLGEGDDMDDLAVLHATEVPFKLLLGRKVMTNLDSIFKSRDITLPTKVHLVKAMVFLWSCMDVRVGL